MRNAKRILLVGALLMGSSSLFYSQEDKKIWISGSARSILMTDMLDVEETPEDTTTAKRLNSGHTLADLDVNIRPNENIFITSTLRVRNDHGGFWGSGTSFDLRQLYMKGLIADAIRFQIGDINYRLGDYTFSNNQTLVNRYTNEAFTLMQDFVDQDLFYTNDQTWRQQGIALDFAVEFNKLVDELSFDLFTFRISPTNFGSTDDELISGGASTLKINNLVSVQGSFSSTYEIEGTGSNPDFFRNNVGTGSIFLTHELNDWNLNLQGTIGTSLWERLVQEDHRKIEDYFADVQLKAISEDKGLEAGIGYRNVGANFRSVGAQSQRINYAGQPTAYSLYGNDKDARMIGWFDLLRDPGVYNFQLSDDLQEYNPQYGNIGPFGRATPNRSVLDISVKKVDQNDRYEVEVLAETGGEIIGQGTESQRSFFGLGATGTVKLQNMTALQNKTEVVLTYWMENTSRSDESEFAVIDFTNQLIGASVESNVWMDLDLIGGVQMLSTSGNELINRRNDMGDLIGYNELKIESMEQILGLGLQYRFNEYSKLRVMYTDYDSERTDDSEVIPYGISNISMMFQINF